MKKFARLKCDIQGLYPNWFLVYEGGDLDVTSTMKEKLERIIFGGLHAPDPNRDWSYRMLKAATHQVNYQEVYNRLQQPIYIRPNGVYMTLGGRATVIEEIECNHFPEGGSAYVVICENDHREEPKWKRYLENRFRGGSIKTINFFDLRSDEDVHACFEGAEYITFSTTFSNMDWFEKLLRCKSDNQKIIGYCHDPEKWKNINAPVEIVELASLR